MALGLTDFHAGSAKCQLSSRPPRTSRTSRGRLPSPSIRPRPCTLTWSNTCRVSWLPTRSLCHSCPCRATSASPGTPLYHHQATCAPRAPAQISFSKDYRVEFVGAFVGTDVGKGIGKGLGCGVGSVVGTGVVGTGVGPGVGKGVGDPVGAQVEEYEVDEVSSSNTLARV